MSRLRIAVFGVGNWGRNHARTVAARADVELAAICDVDATRRDAMQRQYPGTLVTASSDAAFGKADAVIVATPAASHAEASFRFSSSHSVWDSLSFRTWVVDHLDRTDR